VNNETSKEETNMATKKAKNEKPIDEVKLGRIVAAIWRNQSENGVRFNVSLSRLYKSGPDWKRSDSFGRDDLLLLAKVADLAHTAIYQLEAQERSQEADTEE
jgi:hypothetical protein